MAVPKGIAQAAMMIPLGPEEEAAAAAEEAANTAKIAKECPKKPPIWSSTRTKSAVENAFDHWKKHGHEFPEFQNAKQYAEGAQKFMTDPPPGTLVKLRDNGDMLFYDPVSNTFGVQNVDGSPRTFFRPADGINYWNRQ